MKKNAAINIHKPAYNVELDSSGRRHWNPNKKRNDKPMGLEKFSLIWWDGKGEGGD
jgi:hypothetical protein